MRQKEKERIEQVVVLQNGTGIIAGENSYIIKEKGKEEYVLMQKSAKYLEKRKKIFEERIREKLRTEQSNYNQILTIVAIAVITLICIGGLVDYKQASPKEEFLVMAEKFLIYGITEFLTDIILKITLIANYESERKLAKKKSAIHKTINAYYNNKKIPNIEEVQKANNIPRTRIQIIGDILLILEREFILLGIMATFVHILYFLPKFMPIFAIIAIILLVLTIKKRWYNIQEVAGMLEPSEEDIQEAILLITFFNDSQEKDSSKIM